MARTTQSATVSPDNVEVSADTGASGRAGYRRSAGSARGNARRQELLDRVTDDLAVNGLVDFSLRRAARAAGTTHKVLLYYFDGVDDLLAQAMFRLRERRISNVLAAAAESPGRQTLAARVRAVWPVLMADESGLRVIDQAIGLVMYDPERYAQLGREASTQYLPTLLSLCPDGLVGPTQVRGRTHDVGDLPRFPHGLADNGRDPADRRWYRGSPPCAGAGGSRGRVTAYGAGRRAARPNSRRRPRSRNPMDRLRTTWFTSS